MPPPHAPSRLQRRARAWHAGVSAKPRPTRYVDAFATSVARDTADVPLGERVALLLEAERSLRATPGVSVGRAWLDLWRTEKTFYSTTGSRIAQSLRQTGCGMTALAVGDGEAQDRTFPGDVGLYQSGGWEIVESARLRENAGRIGEEAVRLLTAPQCPAGEFDVILGGSQVSLQIHESCGHAAELDRIMGWEANFSGTSFLAAEQLGALRYGSKHVTIVIDNTLPLGLATTGYDDEGAKSGRSDIVRDGILVGFEMSRDTARTLGRETNACVRAESWQHVPMIRMCNLSLQPGSVPFEALFDDVKAGVYMESNRSWSEAYANDVATLDGKHAGDVAADKALRAAAPIAVEPGVWTVILEPATLGELLSYLAGHFSAQAYDEGSSFVSGSLGALCAGKNVTLADDCAHELHRGMPFDFEGYSRRQKQLVTGGVATGVVTDAYWARRLERPNTGHGMPAPSPSGPQALHLVVSAGDKSVERLIAETQRGLLISRFWYIRPVDQRKTIVTGMTRDGTFLIENGTLGPGVRNMRFNQSILEALKYAEFSHRQVRTEGYSYSIALPAVKFERFAFTSLTDF